VIGGSADVVQQPNAKAGQKTYCPVSGVAFQISASSIKRTIDGKTIFFCCEGCAGFFDVNRDRVNLTRHLQLD
jgi:YHS domain-containing protein